MACHVPMALQVTFQCSAIQAGGCGRQVHGRWNVDASTRFALFAPLITQHFPGPQVERQSRKLRSTGIEVDAVQVTAQDTVGDFGIRESRMLFAVHSDKHVEGFTQKMPAAHARVEQGQAGENKRCSRYLAGPI